jgi:hypothetical protein
MSSSPEHLLRNDITNRLPHGRGSEPGSFKEYAQVMADESRLDRVPPFFGTASGGTCASEPRTLVSGSELDMGIS